MSDLIERYVHEVGRYVPQKERADIQAELRSQIHDQLEDRYKGSPTEDDVAEVLRELGDPRRMATSYGGEQYLVGPALYPFMLMVLRRGWAFVPPIVVLVNVLLALFDDEAVNLIGLLVQTGLNVVTAVFWFSAIVVMIFAIIERSGEGIEEITGEGKPFDPRNLPEVDEPGIDRFEAIFGVAIGTFFTFVLIYFLRVGGLTLIFSVNGTSGTEIIPVPVPWLVALIALVIGQVFMSLLALRRNRWTAPMLLVETALEVAGSVAVYHVLVVPLFDRLLTAVPTLANLPFFERLPEIILVFGIVINIVSGISKLIKLWTNRSGEVTYPVKGAPNH